MDSKPLITHLNAEEIHKKLKLAGELFEMAMRVKSYQLQTKNPLLTNEEARKQAYALICRASK